MPDDKLNYLSKQQNRVRALINKAGNYGYCYAFGLKCKNESRGNLGMLPGEPYSYKFDFAVYKSN